MNSITAEELRDTLRERFGLEPEGQIYRLQFNFKKSHCYIKLWEKAPESPEPTAPRRKYTLQLQEDGQEEKSEIDFKNPDSMAKAFQSFKLLKRVSLWYLIDGEVMGCYLTEKSQRAASKQD